jgi:uncharacterized damage-inducible protein DinB
LIDACLEITPDQLETAMSGSYGSILDTMRSRIRLVVPVRPHRDRTRRIEEDQMDLPQLRAAMVADGAAWTQLLAQDPDPDAVVREVDETDGYERDASIGIRLAHALHHGTDHRSQICTTLRTFGVQPPSIDVWDFGVDTGRIVELLPP